LAAAFSFLRGRHRANEDDEPDEEPDSTATASDEKQDEKEPVTAGKWSLRS
jgi:hypothetical protein